MNRAYSILTVKAVDEEKRIITGTATTPSPDRVGDVVEPLGVKFKNPMPLLWQHQSDKPVGTVRFSKPTANGIEFEARLPKPTQSAALIARVDEAWESVKLGLVRAVSIGFRAIEFSFMKETDGIHFLETEVMELSLVTIPAQAEALIHDFKGFDDELLSADPVIAARASPDRYLRIMKSIDAPLLAASGLTPTDADRPKPGVTGKTKLNNATPTRPKDARTVKKTIAEQISAFEATRQAKAARMDELMDAVADKGETLDVAGKEEYDTLETEVKEVDEHLVRLRAREASNRAAAVVVDKIENAERASNARSGVVIMRAPELPKGTAFTRYVMALANGRGNLMQSLEIAKRWKDTTPEVETVLKAAVAAGDTMNSTWALPLVEYQVMASEFIELLRPMTIIGRIPNLRRVPFNIKLPRQTAGSTVGWVGEGSPKPVSALAFETVTMRWAKIAGIVVLTEELVRFSNPSAEAIVRQDLAEAITAYMDRAFVDPSAAAVANINPASITNGVTATVATGTTAAAFRLDFNTMIAGFLAANLSLAGSVIIMTETMAASLSIMLNALGQQEFPGLTMLGGTLFGLPVITSENIPGTGGSPVDGSLIILAKATEIMLADEGGITIDSSREASLQMDSAPDSPVETTTKLVSLWQNNMIGIRCERTINWLKRRPEAVEYISSAKYSA